MLVERFRWDPKPWVRINRRLIDAALHPDDRDRAAAAMTKVAARLDLALSQRRSDQAGAGPASPSSGPCPPQIHLEGLTQAARLSAHLAPPSALGP